jgi:hypothetical protein
MSRFRIQDVSGLEHAPTSAGSLRSKLGEMIVNSTVCRAKVEAINPETGEYRIVLQGTLDREESRWD